MKFIKLLLCVLLVGQCFAKTNLDNVLLIINYNFPYYESIPLLKDIYGKYFNHIIFYGPQKHADVHFYPHREGYYSYMCIAEAMQKYPQFDGYFFLHDDCILNAWFLENLDTSKIWVPDLPFYQHSRGNPINLQQKEIGWKWWKSEWGRTAIAKAFNEVPNTYKDILSKNWGNSNVVFGFSDIVFIPSRYKDQFLELAPIFGKYNTFLELAVPTIVGCLCLKNNWVWLEGKETYTAGQKGFRKDLYFNHPIKLSNKFKSNQAFIRNIFNQQNASKKRSKSNKTDQKSTKNFVKRSR